MWNTIGHEWAIQMLTRAADTQPSHAYLFVGPAHIGKGTLANDFARALNCTANSDGALWQLEPVATPCGKCRACTRIAAGQHPDVRVVRRAPDKSEIIVEQLRDVQNELAFKPYEAKWRIAIIENIDEANTNAANAFLKTLEEPAPQVVLLLTANYPEAVLQTIRSRCQIIPLRPLPIVQVEQALQARGVDETRAQWVARLSGGRIGWALDAVQDEELLSTRHAQLQEFLAVPASWAGRIELAGQLTRGDADVGPLLDLWLSWWRDLLLVKGDCAHAIVNVDWRERLMRDATRWELGAIERHILAIQSARQQIEQNVNARLALEVMLLSAPV